MSAAVATISIYPPVLRLEADGKQLSRMRMASMSHPQEFYPCREVVVSGGAVTRTLLVAIFGTPARASAILLSFPYPRRN